MGVRDDGRWHAYCADPICEWNLMYLKGLRHVESAPWSRSGPGHRWLPDPSEDCALQDGDGSRGAVDLDGRTIGDALRRVCRRYDTRDTQLTTHDGCV